MLYSAKDPKQPHPDRRPPTKVYQALAYITRRLERDPHARVPFVDVMEAIGWKHSSNFANKIRRHGDFIAALDRAGIEEWGRGQRKTSFRKVPILPSRNPEISQ